VLQEKFASSTPVLFEAKEMTEREEKRGEKRRRNWEEGK
jgi:hypothetical protein